MAYKFFIQKKEGYENPPVKNPKKLYLQSRC